jgi:hypothetical protein
MAVSKFQATGAGLECRVWVKVWVDKVAGSVAQVHVRSVDVNLGQLSLHPHNE